MLDEPTDLPDGTVVELSLADDGDELDDQERALLHEALEQSWRSAVSGDTRPAQAILDELRAKA